MDRESRMGGRERMGGERAGTGRKRVDGEGESREGGINIYITGMTVLSIAC